MCGRSVASHSLSDNILGHSHSSTIRRQLYSILFTVDDALLMNFAVLLPEQGYNKAQHQAARRGSLSRFVHAPASFLSETALYMGMCYEGTKSRIHSLYLA